MKPKVSIFIPTKNAGSDFFEVLDSIYNQKEKDLEVIIVDSGSTDETLEIVRNFPIKLYEIKPTEFGHGKTRNLALKYSRANYIVFLSQDALPKDSYWLSNLLINFSNKKTAGIFSRQIPREDAEETEKFFYKYYFPDQKKIRPNKKNNSIQNRFFSNVSSCIRKEILQKYKFNDSILTTEDQEWAKRITELGFKTIYEPKSIVIHSHNHNLKQVFQGYFDSAFSINEITKKEFKSFRRKSFRFVSKEFKYILTNKPLEIPFLILKNFIKVLGIFFGLNEKRLPLFLKRKLSMNKYYWD